MTEDPRRTGTVVHCHVPVTVRVQGRPDAAALAALGDAVGRQVRARLAEAQRLVTDLDAPPADVRTPTGTVAEPYDPVHDRPDGYAVPSYDRRGRRVPVPVVGPPPGRPWRVVRDAHVRARVDEFLDWVEAVMSPHPTPERGAVLPERALYADLAADERWVAVWVVEVRAATTLGALLPLLDARARELLGGRRGRTMVSAVTVSDGDVTDLATFDTTGAIAGLPLLRRTNARRVTGNGAATTLLRGARLVWAGMEVPEVAPTDLVEPGPVQILRCPLAVAAAQVDADAFGARYGLPWQQVLDEAGTRDVRVDVLPARTRRVTSEEGVDVAARLLLATAALPSPEPGVVADTWVAYADAPTVPAAVRDVATRWAGALPALPPARAPRGPAPPGPTAPAGALVVAATVHLPLDPDTLGAAALRPAGRRVAAEVRRLVADASREIAWRGRVLTWVHATLGEPPASRPPGGTVWEYALDDLVAAGDLEHVLDVLEHVDLGDVELMVTAHSRATRHRDHPRVAAAFERLRQRWLAGRANDYRPADGSVVATVTIDHDPDLRVAVGVPGRDVIGDLDRAFRTSREMKDLRPAAAERLRVALLAEREALVRRVASGAETRDLTADDFLRETMAAAAQAAGITEDDVVDVTVWSSLRVVGVELTPQHELPRWTVRLVRVERREGETAWTDVGEPFERSDDEFEAALVYLRLGRAGDVYRTLGIAVSVVGLVAVAWEAGIVAALVAAGGGTKAVLVAIAISELVYVVRVLFFDARLSVEGFLMAAVEGYLGALGFRAGLGVGTAVGRSIGTASVRRVWTGIVLEKLTIGVVGGATSAGLTRFARDVVEVAVRDGHLSSWRTYVREMAIGAAMGVLAEFSVTPVLRALGSGGRGVRTVVADLVEQLRDEGYTLAQFGSAATEALARVRTSVATFADEVAVAALHGELRERVSQVMAAWAASVTARRVLELSGAQFTRQAVAGLEIFLGAADDPASAEAARRLAATFSRDAQGAVHLMEVLSLLERDQARRLMTGTFSSSDDLATFLGRISRYTPDQQRGVLALLAEADLVARPAGAGSTPAAIMERQLEGALRVQAQAARRTADRLRREATGLLDEAVVADAGGRRGRADRLLDQAAAREAEAEAATRLADDLAAGRSPTTRPPPPGGRIPTDLPGDDPAALADELDAALGALEAGTGTRQQGVWIQLPARLPGPEQADALSRVMFTSRSGNPVVFRIEGGTGGIERRSREYIHIDGSGRTRIRTGGDKLNINVGSFERAVEFILEARPGARLKMFEIDAGYLRNLRTVITPEQGTPTLLHPTDAAGDLVPGAARPTPGRISDVQGAARYVDTRQAADQLQLDGPIAAELNDFVVPGTGRVLEFRARTRSGAGPAGGTP